MQTAVDTTTSNTDTLGWALLAAAVALAFPVGMAMIIKFGMAVPSLF